MFLFWQIVFVSRFRAGISQIPTVFHDKSVDKRLVDDLDAFFIEFLIFSHIFRHFLREDRS